MRSNGGGPVGEGAAEVVVVNRDGGRAETAAGLAGDRGRVGRVEDIAEAGLVVNATPVGITGGDSLVPGELLGADHVVVDLIYEPAVTPLLAIARAAGATAVNGVGMLIHQAAHAFRLWTGEDPPVEAMSAAVVAELAGHRLDPG